MTDAELALWCGNLSNTSVTLGTAKGNIVVNTGGLVSRPKVYAMPRGGTAKGVPKSFSDQLAEAETYWCLSKLERLKTMFPPEKWGESEALESIRELFAQLEKDTGIQFRKNEAGRFGNFEVIRYLAGSYESSDGFCCDLDKAGEKGIAQGVVVTIEPPLGERDGEFLINARLFNGIGNGRETLVSDELQVWRGSALRFKADEPISGWEVSVWNNGQLVARRQHSLIRGINTTLSFEWQKLRVITPWSQRLPEKLRNRAEEVTHTSHHSLTSRGQAGDPWYEAGATADQLVLAWFPDAGEGRFFEEGEDSHVDALMYLAGLLKRPSVKRATLADPYFDRIGVERLLSRLGEVAEMRVLTSQIWPPIVKPSPWKRFKQALFSMFSRRGSNEKPNSLEELVSACNAYVTVLPRLLEVINVEPKDTDGFSDQQFHDRFLLIEHSEESAMPKTEVWMLGTSLSAASKRFPLVITRLPAHLAGQVSEYLTALANGEWQRSTSARMLWSNRNQTGKRVAKPTTGPRGLRLFSGSEEVLKILSPEEADDPTRINAAVEAQILKTEAGVSSVATWRVCEDRIPAVVKSVIDRVNGALAPDRNALLNALAFWAYHGGPQSHEYPFTPTHLEWVASALQAVDTAKQQASTLRRTCQALTEKCALPESIHVVRSMLAHHAPLDLSTGLEPALYFHAEVLWEKAPTRLLELIENTLSSELFFWLMSEGQAWLDESRARLLISSSIGVLQALGLSHLYDGIRRAAPNSDPIPPLVSALAGSALSEGDTLFGLLYLCARGGNSFTRVYSFWPPSGLSADERQRVLRLIDSARPNQVVPLATEFVGTCPVAADSQFFGDWCIDQLRQQYRFKSDKSENGSFRVCLDDATALAVARAVWQLKHSTSPSWYRDEVLNKLEWKSVRDPLLRARNYSEWSDKIERVLRGFQFGISLVRTAPTADRTNALSLIAPAMAVALTNLGSEMWHHYGDFNGLLRQVAEFLADATATLSSADAVPIERIVSDNKLPGAWRLEMLLNSPILVAKFSADILALAAHPTLPSYAHSAHEVKHWADRLIEAASRLSSNNVSAVSDGEIQGTLEQWRTERLGEE